MWTFEECHRNGNKRHYQIRFNGAVQPFGAHFYNARGDVKSYVKAAVNRLNRAMKLGQTEVWLKRPFRIYEEFRPPICVTIGPHGLVRTA